MPCHTLRSSISLGNGCVALIMICGPLRAASAERLEKGLQKDDGLWQPVGNLPKLAPRARTLAISPPELKTRAHRQSTCFTKWLLEKTWQKHLEASRRKGNALIWLSYHMQSFPGVPVRLFTSLILLLLSLRVWFLDYKGHQVFKPIDYPKLVLTLYCNITDCVLSSL